QVKEKHIFLNFIKKEVYDQKISFTRENKEITDIFYVDATKKIDHLRQKLQNRRDKRQIILTLKEKELDYSKIINNLLENDSIINLEILDKIPIDSRSDKEIFGMAQRQFGYNLTYAKREFIKYNKREKARRTLMFKERIPGDLKIISIINSIHHRNIISITIFYCFINH
ncbi:MAG: hypothetical protein O7C56_07415, partial [Rickettsia endosymbiont of Ixodes persulcatus]|nr:hypothetical protein [Rickettsia endosymbiont of Ixodes persulcatus]